MTRALIRDVLSAPAAFGALSTLLLFAVVIFEVMF